MVYRKHVEYIMKNEDAQKNGLNTQYEWYKCFILHKSIWSETMWCKKDRIIPKYIAQVSKSIEASSIKQIAQQTSIQQQLRCKDYLYKE